MTGFRRRTILKSAGALVLTSLAPARAQTRTPVIKAHAIPTPGAQPYIIVPGPDGNLWFAESGVNKIGRLDPKTGVIAEFSIPTPNAGSTGIIAGGDGALWFSERTANKVGRITTDGRISEFVCPTPDAGPNGMQKGPDGSIWFAESTGGKIANLKPDGAFIEYSDGMPKDAQPLAVAFRGKTPWFSDPPNDRLGYIENGKIKIFPLPPKTQPRATMVHPNGDYWFVATSANAMMRLDKNNKLYTYPITTPGASPRSLATTPDGNIWFTEDIVNKMGVMSPDGKLLAEYQVPGPMKGLRGMCTLPDGRVFFSAFDSGHIGELIP